VGSQLLLVCALSDLLEIDGGLFKAFGSPEPLGQFQLDNASFPSGCLSLGLLQMAMTAPS
jgi:hypothetical protein